MSLRCWTVGFLALVVASEADENMEGAAAAVMFELLDEDIWFDFLATFVFDPIWDEVSLSELARDDDLDDTSLSIIFNNTSIS